jgi:sporulation protein YlmC with PRC-barrel domain
MNIKTKIGTVATAAAALSLVLAPAALAEQGTGTENGTKTPQSRQETPESSDLQAMTKTTKASSLLKASQMIGYEVKNLQGEDLGQIEEVVIDPQDGRITYVALSFGGGFLGASDRLFAIPWESLTLRPEDKAFLLAADKRRLESAPGFDKDKWPNMADPQWRAQINRHYGQGSSQMKGSAPLSAPTHLSVGSHGSPTLDEPAP